MSNIIIVKGQIIHSEKMLKSTREHNQTSAPKNQLVIKTDNNGGYQVAIWMQYIGLEEFDNTYIFKLKETMSGWIVKEAIKEEDYKDE